MRNGYDYRVLRALGMMILMPVSAWALNLKGKCVNSGQQAVPEVEIMLTEAGNGKRWTTQTDSTGVFTVTGLNGGRYNVLFDGRNIRSKSDETAIDSDTCIIFMLETIELSLQEVTVTGAGTQNPQYELLHLTDFAENWGSNAMDALSAMPQFKLSPDGKGLTDAFNGAVLILIDGHSASEQEVKSITAKQIGSIKYYSTPPARFQGSGVSSVIDIKLKRIKERQYGLNAFAGSELNSGKINWQLAPFYADSLNRFQIIAFQEWMKNDCQRDHETFRYPDGENTYRGTAGNYGGDYVYAAAKYQRNLPHGVLFATAGYQYISDDRKLEQQKLLANLAEDAIKRATDSRRTTHHPHVNLYYEHNWGKNSILVDASANYLDGKYSNLVMNTGGESPYRLENNVYNRTTSAITEFQYRRSSDQYTYDAGARYSFRRMLQDYSTITDEASSSNSVRIYGDWTHSIGKFWYWVLLAAQYDRYNEPSGTLNSWKFLPTVKAQYSFRRGTNLSFVVSYTNTNPGLGDLSPYRTDKDIHFYSIGNPDLRPYSTLSMAPQFTWQPSNKFWLYSRVWYINCFKPYNYLITKDGAGNFVLHQGQMDYTRFYGVTVSASYSPVKWLQISPYFFHETSRMKYADGTTAVHHPVSCSLQASARIGEFQLSASGGINGAAYSGVIKSTARPAFSASAAWYHNNWGVKLNFNHLATSTETAAVPDFTYTSTTDFSNCRNRLMLTVSYNFIKGKAPGERRKSLSNEDNDAGFRSK